MNLQVYVSGALTNSNKKEFYEAIGKVVEQHGLQPYIPHLHTDPEKNPDATPKEVYDLDMMQVERSFCVVAEVTNPSLGVGAELERAAACGIPIVLLYEEGTRVSRLIKGIPTVKRAILYSTEENALQKLGDVFVHGFW